MKLGSMYTLASRLPIAASLAFVPGLTHPNSVISKPVNDLNNNGFLESRAHNIDYVQIYGE